MLFCVGCSGGGMGKVTGTVKGDGKPIPNAIVTFYPQGEGGRASAGRTDEEGGYELVYSRQEKGAVVGKHMITITTAVDGGDYGDTIAKELVPAQYNAKSELFRDVKAGRNVIDFDLELTGEIIQTEY